MTGQEGRETIGAGITQEPDMALEIVDQQMKVLSTTFDRSLNFQLMCRVFKIPF